MPQIWDWTATDLLGAPRNYQTSGPDVPQASMLEHLKGCYPHLTITRLDRIEAGQIRPRVGTVDSHAFQYGILDAVRKELGTFPAATRASIVGTLKGERGSLAIGLSGARPPARSILETYRAVRDRIVPVVRK